MRMMSWRECVYWNNQHENLPSLLRRAWTFLAPSMLCAAWIFSSFDRTRWAKDLYVLWGHSWWSLLMAERLRSAGSINPCLTKLNSLASSAAFQLFVVLLAVWRGGMMCGVFMPWYGFVPYYTIPYGIVPNIITQNMQHVVVVRHRRWSKFKERHGAEFPRNWRKMIDVIR